MSFLESSSSINSNVQDIMEASSIQNATETVTDSHDIATEESSSEDPLTAIQEAAAILMEAESQRHRWSTTGTNQEDATTSTTAPPPTTTTVKKTRTRVPWSKRMEELAEYKRLHGNLLIPIRYKQNPSLGKFVHNTREQYKLFHNQARKGCKKTCSLTTERIRELHELGFVFFTERKRIEKEDWDARFQQLLKFQQENGHTMVPHSYVSDKSFAEWVHRQRTAYGQMQKQKNSSSAAATATTTTTTNNTAATSPLVKGRMERLKGIGFQFKVHSDNWLLHLNQLKEYKEKHGNCQVPSSYSDNPKLARWVNTQRHQNKLRLKGKKSSMTEERLSLLNQVGFSWQVRPSA